MRLNFLNTKRIDLMALHAALVASSVPGITGVSADYDNIFVELPFRDKVTEAELKAVEGIVAWCSALPVWDDVRQERLHLFAEADWRVQRAEDRGDDVAPLRAYRQSLRDITKQSDPDNVVWPVKPWGSV